MKKEETKQTTEIETKLTKEAWTAPKLTELNIASKTEAASLVFTATDGTTYSYS